MTTLPVRAAAPLLLACLSSAASAVPLDFHGGQPLPLLRLFPHQGNVVATWQYGVAEIDPATLEVVEVDSTPFHIQPMPVAGSEEFFYGHLGVQVDRLKALRDGQVVPLLDQVDAQVYGAAGGNIFVTTFAQGLDVVASDGTPAGTGELFDLDPEWIHPCNILCPPGLNSPTLILAAPTGRIYLSAYLGDFTHGYQTELWTRDPAASFPGLPPTPTPATRRLAVWLHEPDLAYVLSDGRLFYGMPEPVSAIPALWVSDGSAAGTRRLLEFPGAQAGPEAGLHGATEFQGQLYFWVERAARRELWQSDGSVEGTAMVKDFGLGARAGDPWRHGSRLYLAVEAEGLGEELWSSDGTPAGTVLVADFAPGPAGSRPRAFAPLPDGRFVLSLDDGVHGAEPFVSDGSAAGTTLLADVLAGPGGSDPVDLVAAGDRLFFIGTEAGRRVASYLDLPPAAAFCPADKLCLQDGRFEVQISYSAAGGSGLARRSTASRDSGIVTFFSPDNWEVMVKVLDGCAINHRFWVFAAAATDVEYEIRVRDLESRLEKVYPHPGGSPAPALTDLEAFATCPN